MKQQKSPPAILVPAVLGGSVLTLLLMLLGTVLVARQVIGESLITPLAFFFLAMGAALAGAVASRMAQRARFFWAIGAGMLTLLLLVLFGAMLKQQSIHWIRVLISAVIVLVAASLGGFAGSGGKQKKKYQHLKK